MCVIAVCIDRKLTPDELEECWASNPDGAGIAIPRINHTEVSRGFIEFNELEAFYTKFVPDLLHVVHFRLATAGASCRELTHPFLCTEDSAVSGMDYKTNDTVMFHNGHYHSWESKMLSITGVVPKIRSIWSDTRALAVIAGKLGWKSLYFTTDKFAVVTPKEVNFVGGPWIMEDGVKFSNTSYKWSGKYTYVNQGHWAGNVSGTRTNGKKKIPNKKHQPRDIEERGDEWDSYMDAQKKKTSTYLTVTKTHPPQTLSEQFDELGDKGNSTALTTVDHTKGA